MKKIISFIIALLLILSLSSCSTKRDNPTINNTTYSAQILPVRVRKDVSPMNLFRIRR